MRAAAALAMKKRRDRYFARTTCAGSAGAKRSVGTQAPKGCGAGGACASSEPSARSVAAPTTAQAMLRERWGKVAADPMATAIVGRMVNPHYRRHLNWVSR